MSRPACRRSLVLLEAFHSHLQYNTVEFLSTMPKLPLSLLVSRVRRADDVEVALTPLAGLSSHNLFRHA
jgi:hypothetical protein